jgi:hypothetical protein
VLGKSGQVRVRAGGGEDLSVSSGDGAPPLAREGACDHGRSAARLTAADDLVDELDEIIGETDGDLFAHTNTVPIRDGTA